MHLTHTLAVLLCLSMTFTTVLSQNTPSNCATIYVDTNQQGNSFQVCQSGNVPTQYNDQASSLTVPQGFLAYLHADYDFAGRRVGPFYAGSYNVPANFNDQLSSVRYYQANCSTFYTATGQQGKDFQLCASDNVPAQLNDQAQSLYVPQGYVVYLYGDYDFKGAVEGPFYAGAYDIPARFRNSLSSARVLQVACVTFYTDYGLQGKDFQLCSTGNVPTAYDNSASSLFVPSGLSVKLFDAKDQGAGKTDGPYSAGAYNVTASFNDLLSSVQITARRNLRV